MVAFALRLHPARGGAAFVAAILIHLAVLAAPAVLPNERPLIARSSRGPEAWLDIETARDPPPGAGAPPATSPPAEAAPVEGRRLAAIAPSIAPARAVEPSPAIEPPPAAPAIAPSPAAPPVEPSPAGPSAEAPPAAGAPPAGGPIEPGPGEYGPVEPGPTAAPGLGGAAVWTLPGVLAPPPAAAPAPTAAPAPRPVDTGIAGKVLSGTLQGRDKELGLEMPAAGVVASTLATAVRGSEAPADSRATFEVRLDGGGQVLGVRVVSASAGEAATWERISKKAAAALSSRALSLGEAGRDGATVIVKVASKLVYPAGTKKKIDVEPVCADEALLEMAAALEEVGSSEKKPRPKPTSEDRPFCIPIGVRGTGDMSNFGANAETLVSSSYEVVLPGATKLPAGEALPLDTRAPWLKDLPSPSKGPRLPPKKWKPKKKKPKK